jgi:hypothetical protein
VSARKKPEFPLRQPLAMPTVTREPEEPRVVTETVLVTPELAAQMLERRYPNQRLLSAKRVASHARAMLAGRWRLTHQGVAFNGEGFLVDGQHRLSAVVQSGCSVYMMVTHGVDDVECIDTGMRTRSVSDGRRMRGDDNLAASTAWIATVKALFHIECDDYMSVVGLGEVDELEQQYAAELGCLRPVLGRGVGRKYPAHVFAAIALCYPIAPEAVADFLERITKLENLEPDSAALALVRWRQSPIYNTRGPKQSREVALRALHAVRLHIEGRQVKRLDASETALAWVKAQRRKAGAK